MKIRATVAVWIGVVGLAAQYAGAWWDTGHRHMTAAAVDHLPYPLRAFFTDHRDTVSYLSGLEPPGIAHYIDIDAYPEFGVVVPFPHDLAYLVSVHGLDFVDEQGLGPWWADEYAGYLSTMMADASTEQDWVDLLQMAGMVAHLIEDLHNPLHLTMNYNGQLTGNYGIHQRYEGHMVERYLDQLPISPAPDACVHHPDLLDSIFTGIEADYYYVDDIMAADDLASAIDPTHLSDAYYAALWAETDDFTQYLFQDASELVAGAWYTAWVNAGSPMPVPEPTMISLLVCGGLVLLGRRGRRSS